MTTEDDTVRFLCLLDELETSRELLKSGFGHLQEIDMGSTFYHLPHQLLASGFERLMKCASPLFARARNHQLRPCPHHDRRNLRPRCDLRYRCHAPPKEVRQPLQTSLRSGGYFA